MKYKVEKLRFSSLVWFIIADFSSAVRKYAQSEPQTSYFGSGNPSDKKSTISALNLSTLGVF